MAGSNTGVTKIDSNVTGLKVAEEASLCVLPATPTWVEEEPNSYGDFGGEITTQARNPINPGRQRKKGAPVDKDAAASFTKDLTQTNTQRQLRGFFFANWRERADTQGFSREAVFNPDGTLNTASTNIAITNVDGTAEEYDAASGLDVFAIGDLVFASGFGVTANNGLKVVTSITADTNVGVAEDLTDEAAPPAAARLTKVGAQLGSGELDVDVSSGFARIVRASGTYDLTDLGIIPGEMIFVGGDAANTAFANAVNNGFKRVRSVSATEIVIDKSDESMVAETGTGLTIQIFVGRVLKNEADPNLQQRRTFQFERTLGANNINDLTLQQAQYVVGGVPSEFTLNLSTASLATVDLSFIGTDSETIDENVSGADTIKSSLGPAINVPVQEADAFNTSSDISRIRLARVVDGEEAPNPIVGFLQELTLQINENAEGNKALGVFGSFEVSVGTFQVDANVTGYFSDVAAIAAVENSEDVSLDFVQVKQNAGIAFDIPLVTVGDGRPQVEQDQPVTIPLNNEAGAGSGVDPTLNHTLLMVAWDYLPDLADA